MEIAICLFAVAGGLTFLQSADGQTFTQALF
jgi:hypothetical protein